MSEHTAAAVTDEGNAPREVSMLRESAHEWQKSSMRLSKQVLEQTSKLQEAERQLDDLAKCSRKAQHADKLAAALRGMRRELKDCARDCMTEAKAMRWVDDNEADIAARSALADYDASKGDAQ